ncbi:MAG: hypothetical protein AAFQ87_25940 [Bacteroidota bacterium]
MKNYLCLISSIGLLLACSGVRVAKTLPIAQWNSSRTLTSLPQPAYLYYSGASGFCLKYDEQIVLHDPSLTRTPLLGLPLRTAHDTEAIDTFLQRTQLSRAQPPQLIINGHTHHDHMFDTPYILDLLAIPTGPYFYGDQPMQDIIWASSVDSFGERSHLIQSFDCIYDEKELSSPFCWQFIPDSRIRVLPIQSGHAPHKGNFQAAKGKSKLNKLQRPSSWRTCDALSYVIEFLDEREEKALRVYIQSSATDLQQGTPPSLLDSVDVAILVAASYGNVDGHPERIIEALNPKLVVIAHWENIFRKLESVEQKPRALTTSDIPDFVERVHRALGSDSSRWVLPNPGTWIELRPQP